MFLALPVLSSCVKRPGTESGTNSTSGAPSGQTLRIPIIADARTLDPILVEDVYSHYMISLVYEGLYEYHYLKRPHEVIPALAESMPEVSKDGLTYTIKIKKGVVFRDHPVFEGGKGREITGKDVIYSWLRIADPKNPSGSMWLFEGHIKGLDQWREIQKKLPETNYDAYPEGFELVDSHTVEIKLLHKFPQLLYILAMAQTVVVPKEAVTKLGKDFARQPVGSGPYMFEEWLTGSKLSFVKNPTFREALYPSEGEAGDQEAGLLEDAGKRLPFADRVEYQIAVEDSPRWLNFKRGNSDYADIPKDFYKEAIDPQTKQLTDEFVKKGMKLSKAAEPDVTYIAFNVNHPEIKKGGPHLRKAIAHALNTEASIEQFYNGRAIKAHTPIPPGVAGYDENFVNPYKEHNLEKAKEELKKAGFPDGKGAPEIVYEGTNGTTGRQLSERFQFEVQKIGLKVRINSNEFKALQQKTNEGNAMVWGIAWLADYPDAENFLQLLYGKNKAPGPNASNFDNPKYNSLYEKVRGMADSPERRKMIREMMDIFVEEMPWIPETHRIIYRVQQPWLRNSKGGFMGGSPAKYLRIVPEVGK
jgi:oligopeptide transport system substrate-binding protein